MKANNFVIMCACWIAAMFVGAAWAQNAPPPALPPMTDAMRAAAERSNAMPDDPGSGPFAAIKEIDPGLPVHVIYRPDDLSHLPPTRLGVLLWGNGGCSDDGASARQHLLEIASHGYVAIAPGEILSGPGAPQRAPRPPQQGMNVSTSSAQVLAGLDWILAENARRGSKYYGRIDTTAIAVSGHSCGGLQALELAADSRIRAVVIHNSGIFNNGANPISGMTVDKSMLEHLHTPILYVLGGPTDVAYENGEDDFHRLTRVPAVVVDGPVGHGGTFRDPNGGDAARFAVKWLDWQLRANAADARLFQGDDCGLCNGSAWHIERNAAFQSLPARTRKKAI